jgi:hypothetical protein
MIALKPPKVSAVASGGDLGAAGARTMLFA